MSVEQVSVIEQPKRPKVWIARGYQASGKTELGGVMQRSNPLLIRVSRDDLRATLFGASGILSFEQEQIITKAERAQAKVLLEGGYDIYVDSTNLRKRWLQRWVDFAALNGADYEIIDLDTPVDECVRRDAARGAAGGRSVGEATIRETARKFPRKQWPVITPSVEAEPTLAPYIPDESLPPAWIVDVDNTIATKSDRDPYDYSRVFEDKPITHTVEVVRKLAIDSAIIILSGREDSCKDVTAEWLRANRIPFTELHMRKSGDYRKDAIVKGELFDEFLRHRFLVLGAIDDRLSVCRLWFALGVPLLRVGDPDASW